MLTRKQASLEFAAIWHAWKIISEPGVAIRFKPKRRGLHLDRQTGVLWKVTWPQGDMINFHFNFHSHHVFDERNHQRNIMLLTKTYFFTSHLAQPSERSEYNFYLEKKIIMSLTFRNKTRKQTTESQATVKQCLGLVQSLLSVWKGRVISANAQARPAYKYRGARRALPPKPPPAQVPQSSSGLLFVMTKQLNR